MDGLSAQENLLDEEANVINLNASETWICQHQALIAYHEDHELVEDLSLVHAWVRVRSCSDQV